MDELTARDFPLWAGEEPGRDRYRGRAYRNNLYGRKEPEMKAEHIVEVKPEAGLPPLRTRVRMFDRTAFTRRYGILLVIIAALTSWSLGLYGIAYRRGVKVTTEELQFDRDRVAAQAVEEYKEEQKREKAAQYFLSGEASREAWLNQNAEALAKDSGVWKTEAAFKAYCWCAVLRAWHAGYPGSIQEVLEQAGQFDFHNSNGSFSAEKFEWAREVLLQADEKKLPAYLTTEHLFMEMRDGGATCVLHTDYSRGRNDDPWRYQG